MQDHSNTGKSVSIRIISGFMIAFMLIVSVLLLVATYSMATGYNNLNENNQKYSQWQLYANSLQSGSDYLTEQVRCFVVTGNREYLDNYFEEAKVTRSRDKAVEGVKDLVGENEAYQSLVSALGESVDLMNREYYAMRLAISGYGYDVLDYPVEIQNVKLSAEDLAATPEEQREKARMMVFDDIYHSKKVAITDNVQGCLDVMNAEIEEGRVIAQAEMQRTLTLQSVLIIVSIIAVIVTFLLFMVLVVSPLVKAVSYIQEDQPIPVEGSREFRFLAEEYNVMHQTNLTQKEELAYEATHDKLTGIYNRNGYDAIRRSVDWDTSALVLFDLDRFKPINDTYGHKMGDRVLERTAKVISNAFRAHDYVCRIGGDEFAVIMVHTSTSAGKQIEEKVDRINEELRQPLDDIPGIQLSCGVAYGALIPNFDKLFHDADAALYRVKRSGGGGCEVCK